MRNLAIALAAAALLTGCKPAAEPERHFSQAALDRALADPGRKAHRENADVRRKPGELIAFAGVGIARTASSALTNAAASPTSSMPRSLA